eukprot:3902221-Prymnesium_polylepis.1
MMGVQSTTRKGTTRTQQRIRGSAVIHGGARGSRSTVQPSHRSSVVALANDTIAHHALAHDLARERMAAPQVGELRHPASTRPAVGGKR